MDHEEDARFHEFTPHQRLKTNVVFQQFYVIKKTNRLIQEIINKVKSEYLNNT